MLFENDKNFSRVGVLYNLNAHFENLPFDSNSWQRKSTEKFSVGREFFFFKTGRSQKGNYWSKRSYDL